MDYPVVTLGAFDGIHRGHRELLNRVNSIAREKNGTGILLTFEPHPQHAIAPGTAPPLLTLRDEKLPLLEETGLQTVVILPFNRELSEMEAEDFVREVLVNAIGVRFLLLGHDHAFGQGRRGRPELLKRLAPELGFELEVVEAVRDNGNPITSTLIRRLLAEGDVEQTGELLGRPYGIRGLVEKGAQRGKELGYPTANLAIPYHEKCIPGDGIYAVQAIVRGVMHPGACNVGVRPTFGAQSRSVEVHLLDFNDDIYGEFVEILFRSRLRDELAFKSIEDLREQIEKDVSLVRQIIAQEEN